MLACDAIGAVPPGQSRAAFVLPAPLRVFGVGVELARSICGAVGLAGGEDGLVYWVGQKN